MISTSMAPPLVELAARGVCRWTNQDSGEKENNLHHVSFFTSHVSLSREEILVLEI